MDSNLREYLRNMSPEDFRSWLADQLHAIQERQKQTNGRLSKLEQFRYMLMGAVAAVTAAIIPICLKLFF